MVETVSLVNVDSRIDVVLPISFVDVSVYSILLPFQFVKIVPDLEFEPDVITKSKNAAVYEPVLNDITSVTEPEGTDVTLEYCINDCDTINEPLNVVFPFTSSLLLGVVFPIPTPVPLSKI